MHSTECGLVILLKFNLFNSFCYYLDLVAHVYLQWQYIAECQCKAEGLQPAVDWLNSGHVLSTNEGEIVVLVIVILCKC